MPQYRANWPCPEGNWRLRKAASELHAEQLAIADQFSRVVIFNAATDLFSDTNRRLLKQMISSSPGSSAQGKYPVHDTTLRFAAAQFQRHGLRCRISQGDSGFMLQR